MANPFLIGILAVSTTSFTAGLASSFVHVQQRTYHEFQTGTNKGFGCYCTNNAGSPTWLGKVGTPKCTNATDSTVRGIPRAPYLIPGVTNLDSGACCTQKPQVNDKEWGPAPENC